MLIRALLVWLTGLVTLVPYGTWYLFFEAPRDQYALLITLILFWIFGYWGVVGPVLAAIRARALFRSLEVAQQQGRLREVLAGSEAEEVLVDLVAADNHLPRFLARALCRLAVRRVAAADAASKGMAMDDHGSTGPGA
jgi:hypothetical protein